MVSQLIFASIIFVVAIQRLFEVKKSKQNVRALLNQGGREHAQGHFIVMLVLHTGWFASMLLEVFLLDRPFYWPLFLAALSFALVGNWLRFQSMKALGERWTVRIVTLPGAPPISTGIYKYIRHPIYLGVMLEIAAIPLLHTAYLTSIFFSIANAMLLKTRIHEEEFALKADNRYDRVFNGKPSFVPGWKNRSKI